MKGKGEQLRGAMGPALLALLLMTGGCSGNRDREQTLRRYNVLLVTLDTTRADRFGCYGFPRETTPHFDALAREGVRFDMAISQAAVTPVSHASILSGLNPYQHGVRVLYAESGYLLPESVPTLTTVLGENGWRTAAFLSSFTVSEYYGFDHGFDHFDNGLVDSVGDVFERREDGFYGWNVRRTQRRSDATTDEALRWVLDVHEPFFLWVHYWDPHDLAVLPPDHVMNRFVPKGSDRAEGVRATYDAEVHFVDSQLGRLVGGLKDLGLYDGTVVVVVADHGEGLNDHGWWHHRILYQEQIRVPLIIRIPNGPRGAVVSELVRTIDIYPTILDWLGLEAVSPVEGESLRPLMENRPAAPRVAYADQLNLFDLSAAMVKKRPNDDLLYCAMDRSWKLIYRPRRSEQSELYHLEEDPGETRNLYAEEKVEADRLLRILEESGGFVDRSFGEGVDQEARERLRALGYAGD